MSLSLVMHGSWLNENSWSQNPTRIPAINSSRPRSHHSFLKPQKKCRLYPGAACRKYGCLVQSHRAHLLAKQYRSAVSTDTRSGHQNLGFLPPNNAPGTDIHKRKVKEVDDQRIRDAFTKSYAFHEPSYLSRFQPVSFRIDGFRDLPITGGNRVEMHQLMWNFLNCNLHLFLVDSLLDPATIGDFQAVCLTAAMANPNVCLGILTAEKILQEQLSTESQTQDEKTSSGLPSRQLKFAKQQSIVDTDLQSISNTIMALCQQYIAESLNQSQRQRNHGTSVLSSPQNRLYSDIKLLTNDQVLSSDKAIPT